MICELRDLRTLKSLSCPDLPHLGLPLTLCLWITQDFHLISGLGY